MPAAVSWILGFETHRKGGPDARLAPDPGSDPPGVLDPPDVRGGGAPEGPDRTRERVRLHPREPLRRAPRGGRPGDPAARLPSPSRSPPLHAERRLPGRAPQGGARARKGDRPGLPRGAGDHDLRRRGGAQRGSPGDPLPRRRSGRRGALLRGVPVLRPQRLGSPRRRVFPGGFPARSRRDPVGALPPDEGADPEHPEQPDRRGLPPGGPGGAGPAARRAGAGHGIPRLRPVGRAVPEDRLPRSRVRPPGRVDPEHPDRLLPLEGPEPSGRADRLPRGEPEGRGRGGGGRRLRVLQPGPGVRERALPHAAGRGGRAGASRGPLRLPGEPGNPPERAAGIGHSGRPPGGAFYLFPKAPGPDEIPFVEAARKENVLVVPGAGFGRGGHFRIAYCVPPETAERSLPAWRRLGKRFYGRRRER